MSRLFRPPTLVVAAAVAAWAAAHVAAQLPTKAPEFTAFPDIRIPTKDVGRNGVKQEVPDYDKLFARFAAKFPRPIPADAPPLTQVRTAQVNEGIVYLVRMRVRVEQGAYRPEEFAELVRVTADLYRIAASLEPTPAGKVAFYEDQVAVFKDYERTTLRRTDAGVDPPHQLNLARFYRLQAEADLIQMTAGK